MTGVQTCALPISIAVSTSKALISALSIIDPLKQLAQLCDVLATELAVFAEVRDQRCDPTAEQAIQQTLALVDQPVLALEHRRVQVAASVLLRGDRTLLEQAVQQGLDGRCLPVLGLGKRRDHVVGGAWVLAPEPVH